MGVTPQDYPAPHKAGYDPSSIPWVRLGALMATVGGAFAWIVTNWGQVRPVLESPASVLLSMMTIYGLGGLSIYWLVTRPVEERLRRAEDVIGRLREHERTLMTRDGEKSAKIAELETAVKFMQVQIDDLKEAVRRVENMPAGTSRRTRARPAKPAAKSGG